LPSIQSSYNGKHDLSDGYSSASSLSLSLARTVKFLDTKSEIKAQNGGRSESKL